MLSQAFYFLFLKASPHSLRRWPHSPGFVLLGLSCILPGWLGQSGGGHQEGAVPLPWQSSILSARLQSLLQPCRLRRGFQGKDITLLCLRQWYTPTLCKWECLRRQRDQEAQETSRRENQRWQRLQASFLGSSGVWH